MRITNSILQRNSLASLQVNARQLAQAQRRVTSGLRVEVASDDPVAANAAMGTQGSIRALEQYRRNVTIAQSRSDMEEGVLEGMSGLLDRARELAIQFGDATGSADTRAIAGMEVQELYKQAAQMGNTQSGGVFIFGGQAVDTPPVTMDAFGNATVSAAAVGQLRTDVSDGIRVRANHNANELLGDTGVLASLATLRDALLADDPSAVIDSIGGLSDASDAVEAHRGELGAWSSQLHVTTANLDALEVNLRTFESDLTGVDLEQAVTEMIARQNSYQAAMLATSRVMGMTLADYLR